ncbi:MAG TPA: glycosyltransferase family 39 protein [Pseudomonadales bacterium]|nr:glycosyltransferase family 39 protein [Pseudomonadales bacterium]
MPTSLQAVLDRRKTVPLRMFRNLSLRTSYTLVAALLIVAGFRRMYHIDSVGLWSDELWGVFACSQGSWWAMIQDLVHNDSHPPGYQTLLYWWIKAFGESDIAVRLPSVIAGVASVAFTYLLGKRHFSVIAGIIAAAMVTGSFYAIYYSQEARAYAFLMFFAPTMTLYFIDLFVSKNHDKYSLPLFWLVSTACMYFHYVGFVFVGSALLLSLFFWMYDRRRQGHLQLVFKAFSPCLILYLPWLPVMYQHMAHSPDDWSTPVPDLPVLWQTVRFLFGPDDLRLYLLLVSIVMAHIVWITRFFNSSSAPAIRSYNDYKYRAFICLAWLTWIPILVFYFKSQFSQSVYTLRHFTYAIPLIAIMASLFPALLISKIANHTWRSSVLVMLLLTIAAINTRGNDDNRLYNNYLREDYRGAVDIVRHDFRFMSTNPADRIVITSNVFFDHYLRLYDLKPHADMVMSSVGQMSELEALLEKEKPDRFYFLEVSGKETSPLLAALESRFATRCFSRLNKMNVFKFLNQPRPADQLPRSELHDCPLKSSVKPMSE